MTRQWFPEPTVTPLRGGPVLRWGVLGPGTIANDFTSALHRHTDQRLTAVASRSAERASQFAARHAVQKSYGSHQQLLDDPHVDIVYIATPHSEHHPLALAALAAGKHVLIEKPMALTAAQGRDIARAASSAGRLAAQAMWTRYLPQFNVLRQVIDRGDLGDIRLATADVGWQASPDSPLRTLSPALGGGAALDMGVYGYWLAHFAIGPALAVHAVGTTTGKGVDEQSVVSIRGQDGRQASVTTTMAVTNSGLATINGTTGRAHFLDPFVFPASFAVHTGTEQHVWHDTSALQLRDGLAWQAAALATLINDGALDSPVHSLADATDLLTVIDHVRHQIQPPPTP